ncbi:MAG: hypothetical protein IJT15_00470 [Rickettsiales bacterium]|nr:hypothetical protein [Rickettsiales bacterium]
MLKNTFFQLNHKLNNYITNKKKNELKNAVFDVFIEADVPYRYTQKLVNKIEYYINGFKNDDKKYTKTFTNLIKKYILNSFKRNIKQIELKPDKTNVVGVFGLNGVGKTSFVAKFANYLNKKCYKSVMCVSFDNQRPTGKEQLKDLCAQIGVKYLPFNDVEYGLQKIQQIIQHKTADVLLVDTAGLNPKNKTNVNALISLIKNICFDEKMLVVDGTLGQNAVSVIKLFYKIVKPTGVVVSKTETDKKGGVFFSVKTAKNSIPIYFVTKGEKVDDICFFDEKFIDDFFFKTCVFGDILFTQKQTINGLYKQQTQTKLNYDFLQKQFSFLIKKNLFSKFKSLYSNNIVVGSVKMTTESYMLVKKWIAIIQSMTKEERLCMCGLNVCRINRIAKGAGVTPSDVIVLKKKLEEINNAS